MPLSAFDIRKEGDHGAIGRNMREPVFAIIGQHLLLRAAVCLHLPDLHRSRAVRCKVDRAPVAGELRAIVVGLARRELLLLATRYWDGIDLQRAVSHALK